MSEKKHVHKGGSTRSERMPGYNLVPGNGHRRTALRFDLGAEIHGENNWKLSLVNEETAKDFLEGVYRHMIEHALRMNDGVDPQDDHLGAIGWAQTVLCYAEDKFGKRWTEIGKNVKR